MMIDLVIITYYHIKIPNLDILFTVYYAVTIFCCLSYIWTVTPFSRRSFTRIIEEIISCPNLSKIKTFHNIPLGAPLLLLVLTSIVPSEVEAFRLSIDAMAANMIIVIWEGFFLVRYNKFRNWIDKDYSMFVLVPYCLARKESALSASVVVVNDESCCIIK